MRYFSNDVFIELDDSYNFDNSENFTVDKDFKCICYGQKKKCPKPKTIRLPKECAFRIDNRMASESITNSSDLSLIKVLLNIHRNFSSNDKHENAKKLLDVLSESSLQHKIIAIDPFYTLCDDSQMFTIFTEDFSKTYNILHERCGLEVEMNFSSKKIRLIRKTSSETHSMIEIDDENVAFFYQVFMKFKNFLPEAILHYWVFKKRCVSLFPLKDPQCKNLSINFVSNQYYSDFNFLEGKEIWEYFKTNVKEFNRKHGRNI